MEIGGKKKTFILLRNWRDLITARGASVFQQVILTARDWLIQNIFLRTRKGILSVPVEFDVHRDSFGLDKLDLRIEPIRSVGGDVGTVQSGGFMSKSDFPRIF